MLMLMLMLRLLLLLLLWGVPLLAAVLVPAVKLPRHLHVLIRILADKVQQHAAVLAREHHTRVASHVAVVVHALPLWARRALCCRRSKRLTGAVCVLVFVRDLVSMVVALCNAVWGLSVAVPVRVVLVTAATITCTVVVAAVDGRVIVLTLGPWLRAHKGNIGRAEVVQAGWVHKLAKAFVARKEPVPIGTAIRVAKRFRRILNAAPHAGLSWRPRVTVTAAVTRSDE